MQRLKSAIKKMAAIGAGMTMLGATLTSAIALDLKDFPQPFIGKDGKFDTSTSIVVGKDAAASDTLGAVDIATKLQFLAKTPVTGGGTGLVVAGGETKEIPIGLGIADSNVGMDWQLQDDDISSLQDTTLNFQSADYDVHDELDLYRNTPSIATSLTSSDDDYETSIVMEHSKNSIGYFYAFDEEIQLNKTTKTNPLTIKFLGKTIKITDIDSSTTSDKFTAFVGNEYFMDAGDTVTVDGKKVTLQNVGIGGAIVVDVDGTVETIPADTTETVNGIEISNDETFYEDTKSERSASLIIGKTAQSTYKNGDAYPGEDKNDPNWVWKVGNLNTKSPSTTITSSTADSMKYTLTGPYIGIVNDKSVDDDSDNPPQIGDCTELPNKYLSICFDSLTVPDTDYMTLTIKYESDSDLSEAMPGRNLTSVPTIFIRSSAPEGINLDTAPFTAVGVGSGSLVRNVTADVKTDKVWLYPYPFNETTPVGRPDAVTIFYEDSNGKTQAFGEFTNTTVTFAQINFGDTKDTNVQIGFFANESAGSNLTIRSVGDNQNDLRTGQDDIILRLRRTAATDVKQYGNYSGFGVTAGNAEADDLIWASNFTGTAANTTIGTKDEDHRTAYGIIIRDPKNHLASDELVLDIPGAQVMANVVVKGTSTSVQSGSSSYVPTQINIDTKLNTEISDPTQYDLILVGGPCANPLVEQVTGLPTCSGWTLGPGEALIKLVNNGQKVALLVAGTDAIDTRMAAKVLQNYENYNLETTEQIVTGTLNAPTIKVQ
ncbi:MAG: S-layer protein [Candidatus Woesearchaeota archaeon]|nr:S-layer protein [Candidatus Woesearchaeota archaeon]